MNEGHLSLFFSQELYHHHWQQHLIVNQIRVWNTKGVPSTQGLQKHMYIANIKDRNNIKFKSKHMESEIIVSFAVLWVKDHNPH